ncbi:MAG: adenylosuccinate lyase [Armatimonadota bacterium]
MKKFTYDTYLSTFTYRYGSPDMRSVFSQKKEKLYWRRAWTALAKAQYNAGLLTKTEFTDIKKNNEKVDISKSQEIENKIQHDVMAEVKLFASQCKKGGGKLHLGATSTDIIDNAEVLKIKEALGIVRKGIVDCLKDLKNLIKENKEVVNIAFTHIQPAEVSTYSYRFSNYAQELLMDLSFLDFLEDNLKTKGLKGAVGTSASYLHLMDSDISKVKKMEESFLKYLGLKAFDATTQVYPRSQDYQIMCMLASCAQTLHKIALDIRVLQSPVIGEVSEPFGKSQVGSSAMPFKKNPILSERVCSIAEYVKVLPGTFWNNAADTILERTLDDSANRRIIFAEGFLAVDETLRLMHKILSGLKINKGKVQENLDKYGPTAMLEPVMMELAKKGLNRQILHERIKNISFNAGQYAPLGVFKKELLSAFKGKLTPGDIDKIMDYRKYTGLAKLRSGDMIKKIDKAVKSGGAS